MADTGAASTAGQAARVRNAKLRRRRTVNIVLVVAVVVIAIAVVRWRGRGKPADDLITATADRADLVQAVSATGSVTAQTGAQVQIGSQITGVIKRLYADVGSDVKKGELIAELDLPDLDAAVKQAQAGVVLSRRQLSEQQA